MSKKILFCIPTMGLGGAEEIIVRLCNYFSKTADVTLFLLQRVDEDKERCFALNPNVRIITFFSSSCPSMSKQFCVRYFITWVLFIPISIFVFVRYKLWSFDVIHINLTSMALYSVIWGLLLKAIKSNSKLVQTFHTNLHLLKKFSRMIFVASWKVCDVLIVEIDIRETERIIKVAPWAKVSYIPFAIQKSKNKKNLAIDYDCVKFGSLARLRLFEKKFDLILKGLAALKDAGLNFQYYIAGDGPDKAQILEMIKEHGLESRTSMLGYVRDPFAFFELIDVLIVATVGGETGIAGLQAISYGIPCVGFDTLAQGASVDTVFQVADSESDLKNRLSHMILNSEFESYFERLQVEKSDSIDDSSMLSAYGKIFFA